MNCHELPRFEVHWLAGWLAGWLIGWGEASPSGRRRQPWRLIGRLAGSPRLVRSFARLVCGWLVDWFVTLLSTTPGSPRLRRCKYVLGKWQPADVSDR